MKKHDQKVPNHKKVKSNEQSKHTSNISKQGDKGKRKKWLPPKFKVNSKDLNEIPDEVNHWISEVGITEYADRKCGTYRLVQCLF